MGKADESGEPPSAGCHPEDNAKTEAESGRSSESSSGRDGSVIVAEVSQEKPHESEASEHDAAGNVGSDHDGEGELAECPVEGCNEVLNQVEMVYHLDLHAVFDSHDGGHEADQADEPAVADADSGPSEQEAEAGAESRSDRKVRGVHKSRHSTPSSKTSSVGSQAPVQLPSRRKPSADRPVDGTPDGNIDELRRRSSQHAKHGHRTRRHSHHAEDTSNSAGETERPRDHHRERRDKERGHAHSKSHRRRHSRDRGREHEPDSKTDVLTRKQSRSLRLPSTWWPFRSSAEPQRAESTARSRRPASASSRSKDSNSNGTATTKEGEQPKQKQKPGQRLGKAELGRYAHEDRMPDWLAVYLKKEFGVCHNGVIPVLTQLLEQSPTTEYAYLCDPRVTHVSRLRREGGFCGYRNIQTMVSYIVGAQFPGHKLFGDDLPSIFDIQNIIENAWDMGINAQGRTETGGIRWTRKYIGTPEAMAMFRSLNIPCDVQAFNHRKTGRAADMMLREVEQYFQKGYYRPGRKVRATSLPPIYWQHPGHSLTIVGIEKTKTGQTNLLVFDPIMKDSSPIGRLVGRQRYEAHLSDKLLTQYRRGPRYLDRFKAFELLKLNPRPEDVVQLDSTPAPIGR